MVILMPTIKPVSDLRNYGEVLRDVAVGQPVFLTKNGHGRADSARPTSAARTPLADSRGSSTAT